jgi:translation initiation factor 2 beta subunit (eIF-2beta)/eIF-5
MAQPEYLICLECETPTYVFEWEDGRLLEAHCPVCGNDDPASFASEEELEELAASEEEDEG